MYGLLRNSCRGQTIAATPPGDFIPQPVNSTESQFCFVGYMQVISKGSESSEAGAEISEEDIKKSKHSQDGTAGRAAASQRQRPRFNPDLGCCLCGVCRLYL